MIFGGIVAANGDLYDDGFYEEQAAGSYRSALVVLRHAFDAVGIPASVVDLGCGVGTWSKAAQTIGVGRVLGLDGDWVPAARRVIAPDSFRSIDISKLPALDVGRFDMAISVEVAEHIRPEFADDIVDFLTRSADVVLFGAGVPEQPGTGHINLQWQSYWARKFARRGYVALDMIRPNVLGNNDVEWWYQQNTILYVPESRWPANGLRRAVESLDFCHPAMMQGLVAEAQPFLRLRRRLAAVPALRRLYRLCKPSGRKPS